MLQKLEKENPLDYIFNLEKSRTNEEKISKKKKKKNQKGKTSIQKYDH